MNSPTASGTLFLSRLVLNPRHARVRQALGTQRLYSLLLDAFDPSAFAHHHERGADGVRGLLYRVEPPEPRKPPRVLVQSCVEPDWSRLEEGVFHGEIPPEWKPFLPHLATGDRLRFRLRAVPTVARPSDEEIAPGRRTRGGRAVAYWKVIRDFEAPLAEAGAHGDSAAFKALTRRKTACVEQALGDWLSKRLEGAATLPPAAADTWFDFAAAEDEPPRRPRELRVVPDLPFLVQRRERKGGEESPRNRADLSPFLFEGLLEVTDPELLLAHVRQGIGRGKAFGCGLLSLARA